MEIKSLKEYYELSDKYCLEGEIWIDIKDFVGMYQVSNYGRVRSLDRYLNSNDNRMQLKKGVIIKPNIVFGGYWQASLYNNGKRKVKKFHRLVAMAFVENQKNKREVNHIDRNKNNNCFKNLEWCTPKENMMHLENNFGFDYGRRKIEMYSKDDTFLRNFESIAEACDFLGVKRMSNGKAKISNISRCLKDKKNTLSAYGYKWKFNN